MAQIIARLAIFFLLINLSTGMIMGSPIAGDLGIQTQVGGQDKVDNATQEADQISGGEPGQETLFGLYNAITGTIATILDVMTAGPLMLKQLGVPEDITTMFQTVILIVYGLGIASFFRGYGIV